MPPRIQGFGIVHRLALALALAAIIVSTAVRRPRCALATIFLRIHSASLMI